MELRSTYAKKIVTLGRRAENANKLIEYMYTNPVISIHQASKLLGISKSNAGPLIVALANEEIGILKEITGFNRNRLFILDDYIRIFR